MNSYKGIIKYILFAFLLFIISCGKPNPNDLIEIDSTEIISEDHESSYFGEGYSVLVQKGDKMFIDESGNQPEALTGFSIKQKVGSEISSMDHFHNGLAVVMIKNEQGGLKWAYINKKGENPFRKSFSYAGEFEDKQAIIKENGNWGIINNKGEYLVQPKYEGVSRIIHDNIWIKENMEWKYVSYPSMNPILPETYTIYGTDYQGTFWVDQSKNDTILRAFATKEGNIISPWFSNANDFSEGLASFKQDGKWGFIDKDGKIVIEPQFGYASSFSEGLAAFTTVTDKGFGDWGYINTKGEIIIPMQFKFATEFKNGYAEVRDESGYRGFIDKKGTLIIDYQYDLAYNFYENLAAVKQDDKWGFINTEGKMVIPSQFDKILSFLDDPFDGGFSEGISKVEVDGYDFFIDRQGNCVMGCLE